MAQATARSVAAPTSVGVIDLERLINGLDQREALAKRLKDFLAARTAEIDGLNTRMTKLREDATVTGEMMGKESQEYLAIVREIRALSATGTAQDKFLAEEINLESGRNFFQLYAEVAQAAEQFAEQRGWDLIIIDDSNVQLPDAAPEAAALQALQFRRVLVARETIDLTDQLMLFMNNQFNNGRQ